MHYTIITYNNNTLEAINEQQQELGTLEYTFWQPKRAHILLVNGLIYHIEPIGFWLTTMEVTKNGEKYAVVKYNWPSSHLVVSFANNTSFIFRRKNILSNTYAAMDLAKNEIGLVQPVFNWKVLGFNYEVDIQDNCADEETTQLLPLLFTYCARHLRVSHYAQTI
jgi:hypothetical protein